MPSLGVVNNPTGKGGFQEHPELINEGGRPKNEQRFGYWLQFFKNLTVAEFLEYARTRTQEEMYVAEAIAYERVAKSREDLKEYIDLANRTEGLPRFNTTIEMTGKIDTGLDKVADLIFQLHEQIGVPEIHTDDQGADSSELQE
jgi:hypothetical protein